MAEPTSSIELSPLDQVRLAEAELTRAVATAREESRRSLDEARAQAARLKKQAGQAGLRQGRLQHQELLARAEEEGRAITAHARTRADDLHRRGLSRMGHAVDAALRLILGPGTEGSRDEP